MIIISWKTIKLLITLKYIPAYLSIKLLNTFLDSMKFCDFSKLCLTDIFISNTLKILYIAAFAIKESSVD